jgi:beta-glucosidase
VAGFGAGTEGEGCDRAGLGLPGVQQQLLEAVVAAGKPVVLVLFSGRPLAIPWAVEHVPAILDAWLPAETGGEALAALLFGDEVPSGKLPVTVPRSAGQVPIYNYHKAGSGYTGRQGEPMYGYTDQSVTPLYPFGHGLSYTVFEYRDLRLSSPEVDSRGAIEISCDMTNAGAVRGDEVVQLYLHDREADVTRPVRQLTGFKRVGLAPGETRTVTFTIQMSQLCFLDRQMRLVVEPGNVDVMVGSSSEDIRLRGAFRITGQRIELEQRRSFLSQARVS